MLGQIFFPMATVAAAGIDVMSYLSSSHCNIMPPTQEDKLYRAYNELAVNYSNLYRETHSANPTIIERLSHTPHLRKYVRPSPPPLPEPSVFSFLLGMFTPKATSNQPPVPPCAKLNSGEVVGESNKQDSAADAIHRAAEKL